MSLIAVKPVLYLSRQYRIGEELPANDARMVALWLKSGAAVEKEASTEAAPKAKPAAARAGQTGKSETEDPDDLAGVVPARSKRSTSRKKKAEE